MTIPKLPSFTSSFAESFKVRWKRSNPSQSSSQSTARRSSTIGSELSHPSSTGTRRRKSLVPAPSSHHSRETSQSNSQISYPRALGSSSSDHEIDEIDSVARTDPQSYQNSRQTGQQRSDETYGQSFTISSRLKRVIRAPTKFQTAVGFIILIIIVVTIVAGLVLGLRNVSLQDDLRNRINTLPVRIPNENESIIGHIKGQPAQRREFSFVIDERLGSPDGIEKDMFVVNGQYPGPVIEVNQGDEVVVNVKNNLAQPSSIHWKGLFQTGTNFFDGVAGVTECGIPAGEQMSYRFQPGSFAGTTYWKAGYGTQASDGLTGGLVVHPARAETETYDEDVMIHLSDLYHDHSTVLTAKYLSADGIGGKAGNEPVPDSGTINGIGQYPHRPNGEIIFPSYYRLTAESHKSYRLRLVNAGTFAPIRFSIDSHNLTVIEADGVEVEPITFTGGIQIEVGQRYSVILHADKAHEEQFWMRASLVTEQFKYHNEEAVHEVLGILAYGEELEGEPHSEGSEEVLDLNRLRPLVPETPPPATQTYLVDYSLNQSPDGNTVGMFNSTPWSPLHSSNSLLENLGDANDGPSVPKPDQFLISVNKAEAIDLIIDNLSGGAYPFSLNGHRPWIIGSGSGRYNGPTSNLSSSGSSTPPSGPTPNGNSSSTPSSPSSSIAPSSNPQSTQSTNPTSSQHQSPGSTAPQGQKSWIANRVSNSNQNHHPSSGSSKQSPSKHSHSHSYHKDTPHQPPPKKHNATRLEKPSSSVGSTKHQTKLPHAALEVHEPYKAYYSINSKRDLDDQKPRNSGVKARRQLSTSTVPIQRDTFTVPKDGWIIVRFVADNPGIWQLSDQTQWHLAAGGAMQISSRKAEWPKVPEEIQKFCSSSEKIAT